VVLQLGGWARCFQPLPVKKNFVKKLTCGMLALETKQSGSCWGNRREGDHWGDLGVDGWMILGWICRRWDVGIWTGLGWPRIETGGGRL